MLFFMRMKWFHDKAIFWSAEDVEREFCDMSHQQCMRTDVHSLFHRCSFTRIYRVDGLRVENAPNTSDIHWAKKIRSDLRHHGEERE
jgi:hypothetical protein